MIDVSHQKELACLANCQLDNSIKNHQELVNSKQNKKIAGNWARAEALVQKNDAELKKLKQSVNRLVNDTAVMVRDKKSVEKKAI